MSETSIVDSIFQILIMLVWILVIFKGQTIQYYSLKAKVIQSLVYLKFMRNKVKTKTLQIFREAGNNDLLLENKLETLIDHRIIQPTDLDPAGIVDKMSHIMDTRNEHFTKEVTALLPKISPAERMNYDCLLQVAFAINFLYKMVRHYYLSAEKTKNFYLILQLNMILPQIVGMVKSYAAAFEAFHLGQPIGDSIGPFVLFKLMTGRRKTKIEKNTVYAKGRMKKRTIHMIKAEGPGGNTGCLDKAVEKVLLKDKNIKAIITIDAGLKMQGEKTGKVEEGIGVAIGGWGVEKFNIEKLSSKYKIPMYCLIIKQSYEEAIGPLKDQVIVKIDEVLARLRKYILTKAKENESILIVGVGNTIGVAQ